MFRAVVAVTLLAGVVLSITPGSAFAKRIGVPELPYIPVDPPMAGEPDQPNNATAGSYTKVMWLGLPNAPLFIVFQRTSDVLKGKTAQRPMPRNRTR